MALLSDGGHIKCETRAELKTNEGWERERSHIQ